MDDFGPRLTTYLIYVLTVPPNSTFDKLLTPHGAQWWSALHSLATVPGWIDTWWSRQTEDSSKVDLFIGWSTLAAANAFSSSDLCDSFASEIQPLLSQPIATVYVAQFNSDILCGVKAYPQGITTVHFAYFNSNVEKKLRQSYETSVEKYAEFLDIDQDPLYHPDIGEVPFEGCATGWAQLIPVSTSHPKLSAVNDEPDSRPTTTFIILISWRNADAEKALEQKLSPDGTALLYDRYIQTVINKADRGYNKHHLQLNWIAESNPREKEWSSTILGRLPNAGYP